MSKKLELITADYGDLQRNSSSTEAELRSTVKELRSRLEGYENIEKVCLELETNNIICGLIYDRFRPNNS